MIRTSFRKISVLAAAALCSVIMFGCSGLGSATRVAEPEVKAEVASRGQLLEKLRVNMGSLATLKAKATMMVIRQDILVPAGIQDAFQSERGKPYKKNFLRFEVNGQILLARNPKGTRRVRFSGQIMGAGDSFDLLGSGEDYRITLPNVNRDKSTAGEPLGYVYLGTLEEDAIRPEGSMSLRPTDICDLLLTDEVFALDMICYMETWDNFYVLNFLRPDWTENVFSKVWIERKNLQVVLHQLFDANGQLVAEGRFDRYRPFSATESKVKVELPTRVMFMWPRDHLVMISELSAIKVNEDIPDVRFVERTPPGYVEKKISELQNAIR